MSVVDRKAFTVVELLVAFLIFGVAATAVVNAFVLHQRTVGAQAMRIGLQQNLRAGMAVLPAELRALDAREGDILKMSPTSITIRALRQLAILCQAPVLGGASVTLTVRQTPFYGTLFDNTKDDVGARHREVLRWKACILRFGQLDVWGVARGHGSNRQRCSRVGSQADHLRSASGHGRA